MSVDGDRIEPLEPVDDPVKAGRNDDGEWVCPECGDTFQHAIHLGAHRKHKHGVVGSSARTAREKRTRSSRATGARTESRKAKIKQALLDLANLSDDLRGRTTDDLPEHLAAVIRRDADQLATMLAAISERVNPFKFFVDRVLVLAAPVTASSGVLRWLLRAWRRQLEDRAQVVDPNEWPPEMGEPPWRAEPVYGSNEPADVG